MKHTFKKLLTAALLLSAAHLQAYSNKTFLLPRSHSVNVALEGLVFDEQVRHGSEDGRKGGNLQIIGFYQDALSKADIGKYFGANGKATMSAGFETQDVLLGKIIHDNDAAGNVAAHATNSIKFNPSHTAYGALLGYHQDLSHILHGLCFKISTALTRVENDMGLLVTGPDADPIKKYFAGNLSDAAKAKLLSGAAAPNSSSQETLKNALINGKQSAMGFADIDMSLGYQVLHRERYEASLNLGLTIPTGTRTTGKYLFEPVVGNANHFGLGLGGDFTWHAWGDDHHNIQVGLTADFRYLLESTERRTLGSYKGKTNDANINATALSQYFLVGLLAKNVVDQQFIPAANLLTQDLGITPGCQLDAALGMAYNNGGFNFGLGYNLYVREAESVRMKNRWDDSIYAYIKQAGPTDTAQPLSNTANANVALLNGGAVTTSLLAVAAAGTPSQITHKIYGGVGYVFKDWKNPVMMGVGAHYEFKQNNAAIENWGAFLKAGVSF